MPKAKMPSSVLVVSATSKVTELISELISPDAFSPLSTASSCGEAKRALMNGNRDIVVINAPLRDEFGSEFALDVASDSPRAVLILVANEIYEQVASSMEEYGVMALPKPISRSTLYSALRLARATHARLCAMERKNKTLAGKMSELSTVNRAKWALISNEGMSEEQAHRHVEKLAMDMRITKLEAAENVIRTYS